MYVKNLELIQDLARNQERTSVPGGLDRGLRETAVEENAMASQKRVNREENQDVEPRLTIQFNDFGDPPLEGKKPDELEKEFGIKIEILDDKPDEWLKAYAVRVSGPGRAVCAYLREHQSSKNKKSV
jgi:hypothetical protein